MGDIVKLYPDNIAKRPSAWGSSMQLKSFRCDLVRPALQICDLWSQSSENLIVGTALKETGLNSVKQFQGGPAIGFMQIEKSTYKDIVKYLNLRQPQLRDRILSACYMDTFPDAEAMIWHVRLNILIARVVYYRRPEPLPEFNDPSGLCNYYLKFYNTSLGKSSFENSLNFFMKACDEVNY